MTCSGAPKSLWRVCGLAALVALPIGGCISHDTLGDLAFNSIEAVDVQNWRDLLESRPGRVSLRMAKRASEGAVGLRSQGDNSFRPLLKIEFTSTTNLSAFVSRNSYNLGVSAYICDRPEANNWISFPTVFWRGFRLGVGGPDPLTQPAKAPGDRITYSMYIDVRRKAVTPSSPQIRGFDLRETPKDVCFYVSGGNALGLGYRSNTVVVAKESITAAIREKVQAGQ